MEKETSIETTKIEYFEGPVLQTPQLNYKVIDRVYLDSGCNSAVQMDLEFSSAEEIRTTFIFKDFTLRKYEGIEIQLLWVQTTVLRLILTTTQEQSGLLDLLSLDDVIQFIDPSEQKSKPSAGTGVIMGENSPVSITSRMDIDESMDKFWEEVQEVDLSDRPSHIHIYGLGTSQQDELR